MQPIYQAVLRSWSIPPAATFAIVLSALVYLRGWWLLRRAGAPFLPPWRAVTFLVGLFSLWVALASPMDVFNSFVLTAHMLQHMVLMMVAPPLILLGAPLVPTVRGLPVFAAREFAGPFLNWPAAKNIGGVLTHPVVALLLMGLAMFAWHTPVLYELALRSSAWHQVEHACFLVTSVIFWWPVVEPWPGRAQWPRWAMVPYLLIADLQNTVLSAILAFSDRVLYPSYSNVPRLFSFSALEDQVAAGAIMWVVGSLAFVVPALIIAVQCLSKRSPQEAPLPTRSREASPFSALLSCFPEVSFFARFAKSRWNGERMEALWFVVVFAAVIACFVGVLAAGSTDDDDQTMRFKGTSGQLAVTVFAPPRDVAVGRSGFSVLVQDQNSQEALLDSTIDVSAQGAQGGPLTARASSADSDNKLLQAAELNFPVPGDWTVNIAVQRGADQARFLVPVHVVKPEPGLEVEWLYVAIGIFSLILLAVYASRHRSHPAKRPARA